MPGSAPVTLALDTVLLDTRPRALGGGRRGGAEFLYFGFKMRIRHHPLHWMAWTIAILIYVNFFIHHTIGDYRWYLAA